MIGFLKGKVDSINLDSIVLDVNGVGYDILVPNPEKFSLYQDTIVYTYLKLAENDISLYGFLFKQEKELFLKLISVKGIGPKSALSMLSKADYNNLIEAIEVGNLNYLKKLPGVGPKAAGQIILDLKGHLRVDKIIIVKENPKFKEAKEALKTFGFKVAEIDNTLSKITDDDIEVNDLIIKALQLLNRK
jgi:Holliday junction DNA helicase RuvA